MKSGTFAPIPKWMRRLAIVCALLSFGVMLSSISQTAVLFQLGEHKANLDEVQPKNFQESFTLEAEKLRVSALQDRRELRAIVLILLSLGCGFTFATSARIFRPLSLPVEPMRRLLVRAAGAVAILRALDGAQDAGIARFVSRALPGRLASLPHYGEPLPGTEDAVAAGFDANAMWNVFAQVMPMAASLALTGTVVVFFAIIWRAFQTDAAKRAAAAYDSAFRQTDAD